MPRRRGVGWRHLESKEKICRDFFESNWIEVFRVPFERYGSFKKYCITIGAFHSRVYVPRKFDLHYIYAYHRSFIYFCLSDMSTAAWRSGRLLGVVTR